MSLIELDKLISKLDSSYSTHENLNEILQIFKSINFTQNSIHENHSLINSLLNLSEKLIPYLNDSIYLDVLQQAFELIHLISKQKQSNGYSLIDTELFVRITTFLCQNKSNQKLDPNIVLYILLSSSELIDPSLLETDFEKLFNALDTISGSNDIVKKIKSNFHEILIKSRLIVYKNLQIKYANIEEIPKEILENIFNSLRFLSVLLNENKTLDLSFRESFRQHDLFGFFTKLFAFIYENLLESWEIQIEKYHDILRDVQTLIIILLDNSIELNEVFLREKMIKTFFCVFANENLLEFLFNTQTSHFYRFVAIFMCLCRTIYYRPANSRSCECFISNEYFGILRNVSNLLDKLYLENKRPGLEDRSIFRMFLHSVTYLQNIYNESFLNPHNIHNIFMPRNTLMSKIFSATSDVFKDNCELVRRECVNECNVIEVHLIHQLKIAGNKYTIIRTLVDILNLLKVIVDNFDDDEIKFKMFKNWEVFFKSVIFYGVVIEKLVCVNLLEKYCAILKIRDELRNDKEFILYLKNLYIQNENDSAENLILIRMNRQIKTFLNILGE